MIMMYNNTTTNCIVFLLWTAASWVVATPLSPVLATSATTDQVNSRNYHVRASFTLKSHDSMTREAQRVTSDCLQRSFHKVFLNDDDDNDEGEAAFLKPVENLQDHLPLLIPTLDTASDGAAVPTLLFKWVIEWAVAQVACPNCQIVEDTIWVQARKDKNPSPALHQQWESDFCTALRNGPLDMFQDVDDCHVAVSSTEEPLTMTTPTVALDDTMLTPSAATNTSTTATATAAPLQGRRQVVFHVRASMDLPVDEDLSADELIFTTDSLRVTYNDIHQHQDDIFMDRATLQHHFTIPHTMTTTTTTTTTSAATTTGKQTLRGSTSPSLKMTQDVQEYTYIFSWEASAMCHYCALGKDRHGHVMLLDVDSLSPSSSFKDKDKMQQDEASSKRGAHEQDVWEVALCNKLRAGPFEIFKKIKSCSVVIYMDPPQEQLALRTTTTTATTSVM